MPIQPVHQPPYVAKSDQFVRGVACCCGKGPVNYAYRGRSCGVGRACQLAFLAFGTGFLSALGLAASVA
jgi:hypothetical protein